MAPRRGVTLGVPRRCEEREVRMNREVEIESVRGGLEREGEVVALV